MVIISFLTFDLYVHDSVCHYHQTRVKTNSVLNNFCENAYKVASNHMI